MQKIEHTLDSREVAKMVEKDHNKLLRDIRGYISQLDASKIGHTDFFTESEYIDKANRKKPCYNITKKGCELIAHKLTGTKGTIFTARYINRFHEMQEILTEQKPTPWYVRDFKGKQIVLFRDFEAMTGITLSGNYTAYKRPEHLRLIGGLDYNGYGWKNDNEKFLAEYGFDYGADDCMMYLYMRGFVKALNIMLIENKEKQHKEIAEHLLSEVNSLYTPPKKLIAIESEGKQPFIQINITFAENDTTM